MGNRKTRKFFALNAPWLLNHKVVHLVSFFSFGKDNRNCHCENWEPSLVFFPLGRTCGTWQTTKKVILFQYNMQFWDFWRLVTSILSLSQHLQSFFASIYLTFCRRRRFWAKTLGFVGNWRRDYYLQLA